MFKSIGARMGLFGALLAASSGAALADYTPAEYLSGKPLFMADEAPKKISGDAGVSIVSSYISRGIILEDTGLIAQPYADLYFTLYEGDSTVSKVTGFVGIWSSLNSHHTTAVPGTTVDAWYEFDWDVGVAVDIGKVNANLMYIEFISPNGGFGTAKNVQLKLSYNDSDSKFALAPYVTFFLETDGKAGTGSDTGLYVELGVGPSVPLANDMKLTFPIYVGLGFSDFYGDATGDDQVFGYAAGGVVFSTPIKFLCDKGYGAWSYSIGGYVYYFGDGVKDANDGGPGTDSEIGFLGTTSIGVAF